MCKTKLAKIFLSLTTLVVLLPILYITKLHSQEEQPLPAYYAPSLNAVIISPQAGEKTKGIIQIKTEVLEGRLPDERLEIEYYVDFRLKYKSLYESPPYSWDTTKYKDGYHTVTVNLCNGTKKHATYTVIVFVENM